MYACSLVGKQTTGRTKSEVKQLEACLLRETKAAGEPTNRGYIINETSVVPNGSTKIEGCLEEIDSFIIQPGRHRIDAGSNHFLAASGHVKSG